MRRDHVAAAATTTVASEEKTSSAAGGCSLVALTVMAAILVCGPLLWLARTQPPPPPPTPTPSVRELSHDWSGTLPPLLTVRGRGFEPSEQVRLFAATSLDASYASLIAIAEVPAAADGSIAREGIDLGANLAAVNGLQLFGRGLTSSILIPDGILLVPGPVLTPAVTAPPTPTATPTPMPLPPTPAPPWNEVYFDNRDQIPPVAYQRYSDVLHYDWGNGQPVPGVGPDNFSAVFTRTIQIPQISNWIFTLVVEGAAKVYVSGTLIIDQWFLGPKRTAHGSIGLLPGNVPIQVEYYTGYDAAISLKWTEGYMHWAGRYFNTNDLQPPLVIVRDDAKIEFDWGEGSPAPGVNVDNFSVMWERRVRFRATGEYEFLVEADDSARVILDGRVIPELDTWNGGGPTTRTHRMSVRAGTHYIQVQYREYSGNAKIKFVINPIPPPPLP